MGRIAARDFVETAPTGSMLVVADADADVAARVTRALPRRRGVVLRPASVDAGQPRRVAALLTRVGAFAIINATHHRFNITAMEAALAAGAHYCDLGDCFIRRVPNFGSMPPGRAPIASRSSASAQPPASSTCSRGRPPTRWRWCARFM